MTPVFLYTLTVHLACQISAGKHSEHRSCIWGAWASLDPPPPPNPTLTPTPSKVAIKWGWVYSPGFPLLKTPHKYSPERLVYTLCISHSSSPVSCRVELLLNGTQGRLGHCKSGHLSRAIYPSPDLSTDVNAVYLLTRVLCRCFQWMKKGVCFRAVIMHTEEGSGWSGHLFNFYKTVFSYI